jgi:cytochrome c556
VCLLVTVSMAVRADDDDVIDYRKHVMATLGEQVAILGQIADQRAPADDLVTHARILATAATTARGAFEPPTPGGESKPAVWTQWSDFAKRLDQLVQSTSALAKAAQDGGVSAVKPGIQSLDCKSCHDIYRTPASGGKHS